MNNPRWVTSQQNQMNRTKMTRTTSSTYKGEYFDKKLNKWSASIQINNKKKHLGYFADEKMQQEHPIIKLTNYFKIMLQ